MVKRIKDTKVYGCIDFLFWLDGDIKCLICDKYHKPIKDEMPSSSELRYYHHELYVTLDSLCLHYNMDKATLKEIVRSVTPKDVKIPKTPYSNKGRNIGKTLRFVVLTRDNYHCRYCGHGAEDGAKLVIDHIISVKDGGQTILPNLITACLECNQGKTKRSLLRKNKQIPSFLAICGDKLGI